MNVASAGATGTAATLTVACLVPVPPPFVHVSVYVVAVVSVTLVIDPDVTVPTLLLMEHVGAGVGLLEYVHVQVMFVGTPLVADAGVAVNVPIVGATGAPAVSIVSCRESLPPAFVHVSVYVRVDVCVTLRVSPLVIAPTP